MTRYEEEQRVARASIVEAPEGFTLDEWINRCAAANCIDWPPPEPKDEMVRRPPGHQLYRHYDADGALLYIGASQSTLQRLSGHRASSHWFWRIALVKIEHYATREQAAQAETAAIAAEQPLFNIERNGKGTRTARPASPPPAVVGCVT